MPFVKRDAAGDITAVSARPAGGCREEVTADDPALASFLATLQAGRNALADTDQDFVRVLEDVIDLLVERGVFSMQDLPEDARSKILRRKALRKRLLGGDAGGV